MIDETSLLKVEQLVRPEYDKLRHWAHAWPHVRRVAKNARELARIIDTDPIPCQIAAYCHDLGRVAEEANGYKYDESKPEVTDHSLDSIEMSVDVMRAVGISGNCFNSVLGAVAVHSDKFYHGKNLVAMVLRDSDKKEGLGPWGILRNINHRYGKDIVPFSQIMASQNNSKAITLLSEKTLKLIKKDEKKKADLLNELNFVLEWVDDKMMDTNEGYYFVKREYEYTKKAREFLTGRINKI